MRDWHPQNFAISIQVLISESFPVSASRNHGWRESWETPVLDYIIYIRLPSSLISKIGIYTVSLLYRSLTSQSCSGYVCSVVY